MNKQSQFSGKSFGTVGLALVMAALIGWLLGSQPLWGIVLVIGLFAFMIGLLIPKWVIAVLYPAIWIVGQIPLTLGSFDFSLERGIILFAGIGLLSMILTRKDLVPTPSNIIVISIGLMITAMLFSTMSNQTGDGFAELYRFLLKAIFAWMVFVSLVETNRLRLALRLFLVSSLVASLFTFFVVARSGDLDIIRSSSFTTSDSFSERMLYGIARVGAGNTTAVWLAILEVRLAKNQEKKTIWSVMLVCVIAATMLALRREVLIIVPVGLVVMAWRNPARLNRIVLIGLVIAIVFASIVSLSPEWTYRLYSETQEANNETRWVLLQYTWDAFKTAPVLGHGPGSFAQVQFDFPEYVEKLRLLITPSRQLGVSSHNSFGTFLVETGSMGTFGLVLMLTWIWRKLARMMPIEDDVLLNIWLLAPIIFVDLLLKLSFADGINLNVSWFWIGVILAIIHLRLCKISEQVPTTTNTMRADNSVRS